MWVITLLPAPTQVAMDYVKYDLARLGLDHVDIVILHAPCRFQKSGRCVHTCACTCEDGPAA